MFEIYKSESTGKFHFRLKSSNGQIVFTGQGYANRKGCENGIASVKKNSADDSKFEAKEAANGKLYFVLLAANKQVIGQSQMYKEKAGVLKGIASVKKNAASDVVKDLTGIPLF